VGALDPVAWNRKGLRHIGLRGLIWRFPFGEILGQDRASVGRPGQAAGDERRTFAEIGNLTPLAGRCREHPDVGSKPVGQCLRKPFPVGRQRGIDDLPNRHP